MTFLRSLIFLRDILLLAVTAFGGPQAHIALFVKYLVAKRRYLTENELMELNGLCQMLPGPSSTQTLIAIGYQRGGFWLALATLLVWLFPAVTVMIILALSTHFISSNFTQFIPAMAVGFVISAAVHIIPRVVQSKMAWFLMLTTAVVACTIRSPWELPFIVLLSGVIAAFKYYKQEKLKEKTFFDISWRYLLIWGFIFITTAILGNLTMSLPIRLFENFYRNGTLIFGGGQVLVPVLYTEFVEFKKYLTAQEFTAGYATVQALPGPVFSFAAYVGALSMQEFGIWGMVGGGVIASVAINLPGMLLIFFTLNFWKTLKQYRPIRASLEGINAAGAGLVLAAAYLLFVPLKVDFTALQMTDYVNFIVILITFLLLVFTKIPHPLIVLLGVVLGYLL